MSVQKVTLEPDPLGVGCKLPTYRFITRNSFAIRIEGNLALRLQVFRSISLRDLSHSARLIHFWRVLFVAGSLELFLNFVFPSRDNSLEEHMSNPTFRRWTADEIAKLKNLAQRHPRAEIAAKLGRSVAATTLKAHELKLSLRMRDQSDQVQR